MRTQSRTLTYYIGVSIDGYIAGPGDEFDFFAIEPDLTAAMNEIRPETVPTRFREMIGTAGVPNRSYDTVLMGRKTYEMGVPDGDYSPYQSLDQYVISSKPAPEQAEGVTFTDADPIALVRELKAQPGLGIWLCGGGRLAGALAPEIDEIVIKRHPVIVGKGVPMFDGAFDPTPYALVENLTFDSGESVQTYRKS
ncbi:dihydrofolate reductase family protein [Glycomyces sp. NPDC046736]|uniref:dihydrofolate reductase family protein n=1 Tax=Glycomyces sp. NPDC046736 TaxID=3155615 RepID=UPI0033F194A6